MKRIFSITLIMLMLIQPMAINADTVGADFPKVISSAEVTEEGLTEFIGYVKPIGKNDRVTFYIIDWHITGKAGKKTNNLSIGYIPNGKDFNDAKARITLFEGMSTNKYYEYNDCIWAGNDSFYLFYRVRTNKNPKGREKYAKIAFNNGELYGDVYQNLYKEAKFLKTYGNYVYFGDKDEIFKVNYTLDQYKDNKKDKLDVGKNQFFFENLSYNFKSDKNHVSGDCIYSKPKKGVVKIFDCSKDRIVGKIKNTIGNFVFGENKVNYITQGETEYTLWETESSGKNPRAILKIPKEKGYVPRNLEVNEDVIYYVMKSKEGKIIPYQYYFASQETLEMTMDEYNNRYSKLVGCE